uniref:B3 domain-containing protein At2g36080-like n=1 Tax=Nelumbo nucifera TaxID=4432 RepID=A0A822ZZD1_NELNU|nr:TPA_asm: hypothetical protein HUJ06_018396 [Nelumbo nucifera]
MSINHFPSDLQEGLWWTTQPMMDPATKIPSSRYKGVVPQSNGRWGAQIYENQHRLWLGTFDSEEAAARSYDRAASLFRGRDAALNFNTNQQDNEDELEDQQTTGDRETMVDDHDHDHNPGGQRDQEEREHMFEKPLTPSDVGKLNRLVIPKQHAEKYFPLGGGGGGDSGEKGLLLSFEDESGKSWRFRYSYWNSSQSYVLTKGWSRFVKEKRLDAGDVVSFERRKFNGDRFYIRWRRRAVPVQDSGTTQDITAPSMNAWTRVFYSAHPYPPHPHGPPLLYQPDCIHAGISTVAPVAQNPTTTGNSKRLRLFGVNLDCQLDESGPTTHDGSNQGRASFLFPQPQAHGPPHYNGYQEINFSQTRNRRGDLPM